MLKKLVLCVILVIASSCGKDVFLKPNYSNQKDLYGDWVLRGGLQGGASSVLNMSPDGRFTLTNRNKKIRGLYGFESKVVAFLYSEGQFSRKCSDYGKYKFIVRDNLLRFELLSDACISRRDLFKNIWHRDTWGGN